MDSVRREIGEPINLVKIDVEGHEVEVVVGMKNVLGESWPVLIVECLYENNGLVLTRFLKDFGYRFSHIRSEGCVPIETIAPDPSGKFLNFLCVAENRYKMNRHREYRGEMVSKVVTS